MKIVFESKRRIKESYIREPNRWELDDLLRALDELGYTNCFHERNGKIIADDVTLKQIQNALLDEYGWEYDIIYKDEYDFDESLYKKRMNEGASRKFSRKSLKESAYGGTTVDDVAEFVFDNYLMQENEVDMEDLMYEFSASHYDIPESFFKEAIGKAEYAYGILADNTYREDRYAKDMLQLSDNHTLYELNGTDDYNGPDDQVWTDIVNMRAHDFEEDTGVELYILGRGGRHICVEPTYSNCIRFDELQAEQRFLEQDAVDTFNDWVEEYKKEHAVDEDDFDESLRPVRRNKK